MATVERHCLAATGNSLMKIVTRLRMRRVKHLLASGLAVKDVAAQTGFYDAFHFSKAFKRSEGFPPSKLSAQYYREVIRRNAVV